MSSFFHSKIKTYIQITLCCIVVIFIAVVSISNLPQQFQRELSGMELLVTGQDDETGLFQSEILQKVEIRIDGQLRNGLFLQPRFQGVIEIDAYKFTIGNIMDNLYFFTPNNYPDLIAHMPPSDLILVNGMLSYWYLTVRGPAVNSLGQLYTNQHFNTLAIRNIFPHAEIVDDFAYLFGEVVDDDFIRRCRVIVAPVTDKYTAHEILRANMFYFNEYRGVSAPAFIVWEDVI